MVDAGCLCGGVAWRAEAPLELVSHCHCSRCRKAHGTAFATYAGVSADAFRWLRGRDSILHHESSAGFRRPFCPRCGSVVAGEPTGGRVFFPLGNVEGDPGVRPVAHIFVASKAGWDEIADALPRFDAYPPGWAAAELPPSAPPEAAPAGAVRGSCLCGGVAYVLEGPPSYARHCHCGRCRRARSAAHASNLVAPIDGVRFVRGEAKLRSYKVPEAERFTQTFCRDCGGPMPRLDPARGIAVIPMGSLDDEAPIRPGSHIFAGSKAPWFEICDALPRYETYPPT